MGDTRWIEMYVGSLDFTWYTLAIEIPADTADDAIERTAVAVLMQGPLLEAAFVGVYHVGPLATEAAQ